MNVPTHIYTNVHIYIFMFYKWNAICRLLNEHTNYFNPYIGIFVWPHPYTYACMWGRLLKNVCTHTHLLTRELHLCKDILWCVTMNGVYWPMQTQLVGRRIYFLLFRFRSTKIILSQICIRIKIENMFIYIKHLWLEEMHH